MRVFSKYLIYKMGCYKAAVQVLKDADELKAQLTRQRDWLNDASVWVEQQKLQTIYHQVLILDLEYALDKKVELELWNIGFKNHITHLQELIRDKKNPHRSDLQTLLAWSLDAASGFYLTLLQELCDTFDIDVPFRKSGLVYGQMSNSCNDKVNMPQMTSCLYICQYCFVHLGDIARYRNQRSQAESFYRQAILVSPHSGHPYNQLALLRASQGDKLSTVFYYIRATAVRNPFPASKTNLHSILSAAIEKDCTSDKSPSKMTANEFIQLFLRTNGYFHTLTELDKADKSVKLLNSVMTALVATQCFKNDELVKIIVINIYTLTHLGKYEDMTGDEKFVRNLVLELMAGSLSALLIPVHTLKMDETLLEYYALPSIKLLMFFIKNNPEVLRETTFAERLQIWPSLCKLVNNNCQYLKGFNYSKYLTYPLPEDISLKGFLSFAKNLKELNFKEEITNDKKIENLIRMQRILDFTEWLCDSEFVVKLLTRTEDSDNRFAPICTQPDPTNDLLEEMKSFNMIDVSDHEKKPPNQKTGILKPQGSLERSREEREALITTEAVVPVETGSKIDNSNVSAAESIKVKRSKQNVALQSIYKKMEESSKQVKFSSLVESNDHGNDKLVQNLVPNQKTNQSFKFNVPPPQTSNDYLASLRNMSAVDDTSVKSSFAQYPQKSAPSLPPYHQQQQQFNHQNQMPYRQPQMQPHYPLQNPPIYIPQNNAIPFTQHTSTSYPLNKLPLPPPSFFQNSQQQFSQHNTSKWPRDDSNVNSTTSSWWPNSNNQNYMRTDSTPTFPIGSAVPYTSYHPNFASTMPPNLQQMKSVPPPNSNASMGAYDTFAASPWRNSFPVDDSSRRIDNGMSVREAMLKEANYSSAQIPNSGGPSQSQAPPHQAYSLFNNSWTPNLPAQLRNSGNNNMTDVNVQQAQHSLFGGHGPTSLTQLLEYQRNQMKKDDT